MNFGQRNKGHICFAVPGVTMILQANLSLSLLTSLENTHGADVLTKSLVAKEERNWVNNTVCS